ncbi:MAG: MaoC family dehydratase [Pseudomonadota bacterium]
MNTKYWYFEDFAPGQELVLGSHTVTEEEIIAFATQFDPQPFHLDHEAAESSIFGGLAASGWHTCSMMMRIVVDGILNHSSSLGSPGLEKVRWLLPVHVGDTLTVTYLTREVKGSVSRPERGVVWTTWQAANQRGDIVCTVDGMGMFGRRPKEGGDA